MDMLWSAVSGHVRGSGKQQCVGGSRVSGAEKSAKGSREWGATVGAAMMYHTMSERGFEGEEGEELA